MPGLDGRVAVVTGGTRGIGPATRRAPGDACATVVLTGRDARVGASRAKELTTESGIPADECATVVLTGRDARVGASRAKELTTESGTPGDACATGRALGVDGGPVP